MSGALEQRPRGIAFAALVVGGIFAISAIIGGGIVAGAIELAWIAWCLERLFQAKLNTLKLMFLGALLLFVIGCALGFFAMIDGLGLCEDEACVAREAVAESRLLHVWVPFVLATIAIGLGSIAGFVASLRQPPPDTQVPPARVTSP